MTPTSLHDIFHRKRIDLSAGTFYNQEFLNGLMWIGFANSNIYQKGYFSCLLVAYESNFVFEKGLVGSSDLVE